MKIEELEVCVVYILLDSLELEYEFENVVYDNVFDLVKIVNYILNLKIFLMFWKCIIIEMYVSKYFRIVSYRVVLICGFINV